MPLSSLFFTYDVYASAKQPAELPTTEQAWQCLGHGQLMIISLSRDKEMAREALISDCNTMVAGTACVLDTNGGKQLS